METKYVAIVEDEDRVIWFDDLEELKHELSEHLAAVPRTPASRR